MADYLEMIWGSLVDSCERFEQNFVLLKRRENHSVSELLTASQERLLFVVLVLLRSYIKWISVFWTLKSRRMRWARHVARMGEGRGVHRVLVGKPEGKRPLGRPRRRWGIILRWIFRKWEGVVGTGWSCLRIGTGGGHLWVRWWTLGFQKCGEFLD